jgi:minor extracellular serine protease Vpr
MTNSVITVAAHVTNAGIASFSSYGPRMDDVMKPDISAPGNLVCSALSSFANGTFSPVTSVTFHNKLYEFVRLSGTSMSGPAVAGIVSLLLEANPWFTPWQIKNIVKNTARTDTYTGAITAPGHVRWGMGKINAYAAMQEAFVVTVDETANTTWNVYPNPASDRLFITGETDGTETFELVSLDGKQIQQGRLNGSIDISTLNAGMYVLTIKNTKGIETFRVVIGQ